MRITGRVKTGIQLVSIIFVVSLCILHGFYILTPTTLPQKQSVNEAFSKTMEHLRMIAKEPHPTGTTANEEVRHYLTDHFDRLQLSYESISFTLDGMTYVNYLVKMDAPATEDGVMLVSHYDSVSAGPGAADDGISVASMLTVMENIVNGQANINDMYFLFTDGEELGLLGADYFIKGYGEDYIDKIKLVINLEARGNRGALFMFETSSNNYNIAKMLQKAVPSGSTPFSFAAALYKTMPNDTDLTRFLEAGFQGMNFAVVRGGECYHTEQDNVDNLSRDTAYMYYATVSELSSYLGSIDLHELSREKEGVYFPVTKGKFFVCKESTMYLFSIFSLCIFIITVIFGIVKRRVRFDKLILSFSAFGIFLVASYGLLLLIQKINGKVLHTYVFQMIFVGLLGLLIYIVAKKHLRIQEHLILWGSLFSILGILSYILFPAFVYMISIILFIITLLLLTTVVYRGKGTKWLVPILAGILCLVCTILYVPVLIAVYDSLLYVLSVNITGLVLGITETMLYSLCIGCLLLSFKVNTASTTKTSPRKSVNSLFRQLLHYVKQN